MGSSEHENIMATASTLLDYVSRTNPLVRHLEARAAKAAAEGRWVAYEFDLHGGLKYWQGRIPKKRRPYCGARCRDGHACRARVLEGKTKCRTHGGLSTGPRTTAGRAAIAESNRRRAQLRQDSILRQAPEPHEISHSISEM